MRDCGGRCGRARRCRCRVARCPPLPMRHWPRMVVAKIVTVAVEVALNMVMVVVMVMVMVMVMVTIMKVVVAMDT